MPQSVEDFEKWQRHWCLSHRFRGNTGSVTARLYKQDEAEDTSHYFDLVTLYRNSSFFTIRRNYTRLFHFFSAIQVSKRGAD